MGLELRKHEIHSMLHIKCVNFISAYGQDFACSILFVAKWHMISKNCFTVNIL